MGKQGKARWQYLLSVIGMGLPAGVFASVTNTTTLTATIVASSCVGEILTLNSSGRAAGNAGTVDFGVINPKSRAAPVRQFSLRLSEVVGGKTGCSAFEAYGRQYPVATLSFGDAGNTQLDEAGVILRYDDGSDTHMRVRVSPLNAEGTFPTAGAPGYVTATHAQVTYPIPFAVKGMFDFQAILSEWQAAKSGAFSGTLTVTVVYR
ncbi:hypothetical protein AB7179_11470 [Providencia manganoxydans]|uniref:hypothetical protein n=1 Tax=Providencia TaxID=586 RepID=UPI0012B5EC82|nr:hypothetical protein [Providencia sp. wls1943]ELR5201466.1 hypothetical protein [Providencia rettgeri]MTB68243.1 hypothetical protein [Providencia sp. wls1943]